MVKLSLSLRGCGRRSFDVWGALQVAIQLSEAWNPAALDSLPADVFAGGWVGYTSYDTVRYVYPGDDLPRLYQASVTSVSQLLLHDTLK